MEKWGIVVGRQPTRSLVMPGDGSKGGEVLLAGQVRHAPVVDEERIIEAAGAIRAPAERVAVRGEGERPRRREVEAHARLDLALDEGEPLVVDRIFEAR